MQMRIFLWAFLFVVVVSLGIGRAYVQRQNPGKFDPECPGFCDFHNGVYFPSLAFRQGVSPYGSDYAEQYPVDRAIPFYSPAFLITHLPLTWLPLAWAEVVYQLVSVGLLLAIAWCCSSAIGMPRRWDALLAVGTFLALTRGGHISLVGGYFTLELVLATILALRYADQNPGRSALALVVVSFKPTFVLPIGILMLARGNWKAILYGACLSLTFAGIAFAYLAIREGDGDGFEGAQQVLQQIAEAQETHRNVDDETPVASWTRVDLLAVVAKWMQHAPNEIVHLVGMLGMLFPVAGLLIWLRQTGRDAGGDLAGPVSTLMMLTSLVAIYHQYYDCLLLIPGALAAWGDWNPSCERAREWGAIGINQRRIIAALLATPSLNFLSTQWMLRQFEIEPLTERLITSINGIALALAVGLLVWEVARRGKSSHAKLVE